MFFSKLLIVATFFLLLNIITNLLYYNNYHHYHYSNNIVNDQYSSSSLWSGVVVEAASYRFLSELTNTTRSIVPSSTTTQRLTTFDESSTSDHQAILTTTTTTTTTNNNHTIITSTSTIGFGSFIYTYESDDFTWQIIMDSELPSFTNMSESISLRYYRLVHRNVLLSGELARNAFINNENISTILTSMKLLNGSNGLAITPDEMIIKLNGTTNGRIGNSSKVLEIPELFESAYSLQMFSLELNTSKLQDNSTNSEVRDSTKILVDYTQFRGKNPTYTYRVLESLKEYIKIVSVTSVSLRNLCRSSSPIVAFAWNSWKLWFVLCVVILMLTMLVASWWRPYFIVFMTLVVLNLSGIINISQTLNGFSNDGMLTVLLLFPIVQPLSENSLVLRGSKLVFGTAKYGLWLCMLRLCLVVSVISPFINNTPIVVTALPIIKDWARENNIAASKFLMAMCYITTASSLMTLIGTSTNIVTNGLYTAYGYEPFTFYEFFFIGSILTLITIIYLCTFGLWISPNKKGGMFRLARERGEKFLTKLVVDRKNSPLIGKNKSKVISNLGLEKLEVVEIIRKKAKQEPSLSLDISNDKLENKNESSPRKEKNSSPTKEKNSSIDLSPRKEKKTTNESSPRKGENTTIESPRKEETSDDEDLEHIVPVPDDLTIQLNDTIIFKGHPNNILKLHSMVSFTNPSFVQDQKEVKNILHTMLGTENLQNCENSPLSPRRPTTTSIEQENDQEIIVEISDSEAASTNDFIIGESDKDEEDKKFSSAPPIPKTSLKNKIKEHNLNESVLKKGDEDEEKKKKSTTVGKDEIQQVSTTTTTTLENPTSTSTEPEKKEEKETSSDTTENKKSKKDSKKKEEAETNSENEPEFFEVVISTFNPCIGELYSDFEKRYCIVILAVRHNKGLETKTDVTDFKSTKVKTGDTLLIIGKAEFYSKWHETKDFYVISRCNVSPKEKSKYQKFIFNVPFTKKSLNLWWWEHLIFPFFIAMIACAIAGFSMLQCAMVTLCVVIIFRLINPIKAIESIEWPLIALIGSSFGIGTAITQSGMGEALAELLRLMNVPVILLPAFVVFITLIVTAVITNNAAVAVCFPLAMAIAKSYGLNPRCFAMCVCIAASSVFATPIGYQCNMMIMGPGGYSFLDYVKVGLPLTIIYFFAISTFVPLIWGLQIPNY